MHTQSLNLLGAGIATDGYDNIQALAASIDINPAIAPIIQRAQPIDPQLLTPHDPLIQSALASLHQAITMTRSALSTKVSALFFVTHWGMIDPTTAYLDSMLDSDGRYASPRHFTRSIYSAATSALAIHFQIHGPCQTLAFDPSENPVHGALAQAARLLAAKRADQVAIVWAEQAGPLAEDLATRAFNTLHRREFHNYRNGNLGHGAIAILVSSAPNSHSLATFKLPPIFPTRTPPNRGKPFPMDHAVLLLNDLLRLRTDFRI